MEANEGTIADLCQRAVDRLHNELEGCEVGCLLRYGDVIRHVAHAGKMRLIYEIPEEWRGIIWRAAEQGKTQLVKDVRSDADYLAQNEDIRAEVAVPIRVGDKIVGVLNVEGSETLDESHAAIVEREAERLGRELDAASVLTTRR